MNLKTQLLESFSKQNSQLIADYVGMDPKKYRRLLDLVKDNEKEIYNRAAWALDHCIFSYSSAIESFIPEMIQIVKQSKHKAVKRNLMKIIAAVDEIPEDLSSAFFDHCVNWIIDKHTSIAVRVYAMEIVAKIAMPYPELREEIKILFEDQLTHGSAGVKVRARRLIKKLSER